MWSIYRCSLKLVAAGAERPLPYAVCMANESLYFLRCWYSMYFHRAYVCLIKLCTCDCNMVSVICEAEVWHVGYMPSFNFELIQIRGFSRSGCSVTALRQLPCRRSTLQRHIEPHHNRHQDVVCVPVIVESMDNKERNSYTRTQTQNSDSHSFTDIKRRCI
jgi:hypothetical protein